MAEVRSNRGDDIVMGGGFRLWGLGFRVQGIIILGEGSLSSKASGVGQVAVEAARQAKRQWPQFSHMRMIADIAAIASFHSVLTGKSGQHHHLCAISI